MSEIMNGIMNGIDILVSEVGPRDGLQAAHAVMSTEHKKRWIAATVEAGVREIEVCSFVPPKLVPAMAEGAMKAGAHKITIPVSVSAPHNKANLNRSHDESVADIAAICRLRDSLPPDQRPAIEAGLSTVWGCTIQGEVPEDDVLRLAARLVEAGVDEVGLADTTGMAHPAAIKSPPWTPLSRGWAAAPSRRARRAIS